VLRRAGYVLGSATIELRLGDQDGVCLVSAGALGRSGRPILRGPDPVAMADVLLVDAMYGDRAGAGDPSDTLARIVCDTAERRGAVVVPVGLAGEAQELLWALHELEQAGRVPSVPVFVDGPMATDLTEQYGAHLDDHNLHLAQLMDVGGSVLRSARYELVRSIADSMSLTDRPGPIIILSGDAMAAGGRVLHHLKRRLADERTIVLLPGHQAAGTPGRALCDGALELRIHGEHVPVRARVIAADGFSPHADRDETLRWLGMFHHLPRTVHVVRGEPAAAMALAEAIRARFGCHATVARDGETVGLEQ
jgi:metallo-beta-lactamase family protein